MMRRATAAVTARRLIADNILEVTLDRPDSFAFAAGQYFQVGIRRPRHRDRRGSSRVFSIASSPNQRHQITFAFRRSPSGFKRTIEDAPIGSPVMLAGPYGFMTLTQVARRPRILVASGIGITPFLSMIRFASEESLDVPLTLVYSNSSRQHAAYLDELQRYADQNPNFTLRTCFGNSAEPELARAHAQQPDASWLLSGAPARLERANETLRRLGVDDRRIVAEEFLGY